MVENGKPDEEAVVANNEAEDYFPTNGEGSTDSPSQKNHVSGSTTSAGTALDMRLSKVSQAYDRGNKGYLDSTELTLRQMDTDNKGHLDVDKVYALMQEFKQEQKKTMTFKRVIIALCVFALLLALANIGTSFAAATLAKDTKVSPDGNLAAASSERTVGTIAKHNGYKATQNLSGDANQTLSRLLQTNSNATQAGDRFYTTKADTDALFEDICNEWLDGGMASWDGSTVGCATGADYVTLSHCGYQTKLKFRREPNLRGPNNDIIVFRFHGYRDDWKYGRVTITCDLAAGASDYCVIDNISCQQVCDVCLTSSSDSFYWFCNDETDPTDPQVCGCSPGEFQCLSAKEAGSFCATVCYDPSGGGGASPV